MSIDILFLAMADGISYAGLLFLVSLGLTFIFGVTKVLNVAHGSLYAMGGYTTVSIGTWLASSGDSLLSSIMAILLGAIIVGIILGLLLERILNLFDDREPILQLLVTFGVFMILEDVQRMIWGTEPYFGGAIVDQLGNIEIMDIIYTRYQVIFIPAVALVVFLFLRFFLNKTLMGRIIMASTWNTEVAEAIGIKVQKVRYLTFILGGTLGALGGALASPVTSMSPGIGAEMIVLSFAVVATAGLGQITGALITALVIGVCRSISIYAYPELEVVVPYLIMGLVLLFRPEGLFTVDKTRSI